MTRRGALAPLAAATVVILAATLTPQEASASFSLADSLSPARVRGLLCLQCGPAWASDMIGNVLLFVPLGAALRWCLPRRPWQAVLAGLLLSLVVEIVQLTGVVGGRHASLVDLATNTAGTALGVWLAGAWGWLVSPAPGRAALLALSWSALAASAVVGTAWALTPPPIGADAARGTWGRSPFPFTPGFGWFAGTVSDMQVNGTRVPTRGSGPVILLAPAGTSRVSASFTQQGRDARGETVPLLFVHARREFRPLFLAGAQGAGWVVQDARRATALGLVTPALQVTPAASETARASDTWRIDASSSPSRLEFRARGDGLLLDATLAITPTLGWALVQSLVGASHPAGAALTLLWLCVLAFPAGYWSWWSDRHRATTALAGGLSVALALQLSPRHFAIAVVPAWQWWTFAFALLAGMAVGRLRLSRHDASHDAAHDASREGVAP